MTLLWHLSAKHHTSSQQLNSLGLGSKDHEKYEVYYRHRTCYRWWWPRWNCDRCSDPQWASESVAALMEDWLGLRSTIPWGSPSQLHGPCNLQTSNFREKICQLQVLYMYTVSLFLSYAKMHFPYIIVPQENVFLISFPITKGKQLYKMTSSKG